MTSAAIDAVTDGLRDIGYGPDRTVGNYEFSNIWSDGVQSHAVELAAFTHFPPSYRSAAFSVLEGGGRTRSGNMGWLASLGAPIAFVVEGERVRVVRVGESGVDRTIRVLEPKNVAAFIAEQRATWSPDRFRRLKMYGADEPSTFGQLDFFDSGLMTAVAALTRKRLATLLGGVIGSMRAEFGALDRRALTLAFRLLAAKVLIDRRHPNAEAWHPGVVGALAGVEAFYGLPPQSHDSELRSRTAGAAVSLAWQRMQQSMSFANVSSDDLAFVYENSFVTDAARKSLGTHSTPREVVDYACERLPFDLTKHPDIKVVEPFSGAGIFLIEAVRHLSEQLGDMSAENRHAFLVERILGADTDEFACEVASLALVLADYPNRNGWQIEERDLFAGAEWMDRIDSESIVFCNPPYADFTPSERKKYAPSLSGGYSKPLWVASRILSRKPKAVALVLPRAFALDREWAALRSQVEANYADVEVLALPENTFAQAGFETCLVLAKNPRAAGDGETVVTSSFVARSGLADFRATGMPTWSRAVDIPYAPGKPGRLWAGDLSPVWDELRERCETLGSRWEVHRGIEWVSKHQQSAWSDKPTGLSRPGYHPNDGMQAFEAPVRGHLDVRPEKLLYKAVDLPWDRPKVLLNAARRSRGPWRVTAFVERGNFAASQQFIGIWPKASGLSLESLAAVINGPVANAFLDEASFGKGLRLSDLKDVPLPPNLDDQTTADLVRSYVAQLKEPGFDEEKETSLRRALLRIDAHILAAYDLDPWLESNLLRHFDGHQRQVPLTFLEFYPPDLPVPLPLGQMIDGTYERAKWTITEETIDELYNSGALSGIPDDFFG